MRLGRILAGCGAAVLLAIIPAVVSQPVGAASASHAPRVSAQVSASNWSIAPGPTPAPSDNSFADSVSCATSTFCIGVGFLDPLYYGQQWNGSAWSQMTLPAVSGTVPELSGVSCVSTTWCVAVGTDRLTTFSPLILQWDGSRWSVVQDAATNDEEILSQVSCAGPSSCLAVGFDSTTHSAFAEVWNGSSWSPSTVPALPGTNDSSFQGVSCPTVAWCMVTGSQETGSTGSPLAESWNGTAWTVLPTAQGVAGHFSSVSCAGTGFCAAAGDQGTSSSTSLVEFWNGSTFTAAVLPDAASAGDSLNGISCVSATSCTAVGADDTSLTTNVSLAMTWDGQTWRTPTMPSGPAGDQTGLSGVSCLTDWACMAVGNTFNGGSNTLAPFNVMAPIARNGYRFVASDGGVFAYGPGAPFLGSMGGQHLNAPIVGMATMPAGDGYYLVAADGGVFNFGSAAFYGSAGNLHLNAPIVGMAVTADGAGYWLVAADGGIFSYGDAQFYGSTGAITLNKPIVGMAATPNGRGYYLVASDGGIFAYGNAVFSGSMGGTRLNKPVVGMAVPVAGGYYLVASDGGIFSFPTGSGGPPFYGSTGAITLNKPIVGMGTTAGGYYLSGSDGGVFSFPGGGVPTFFGSTGSITLNKPIVGISG